VVLYASAFADCEDIYIASILIRMLHHTASIVYCLAFLMPQAGSDVASYNAIIDVACACHSVVLIGAFLRHMNYMLLNEYVNHHHKRTLLGTLSLTAHV